MVALSLDILNTYSNNFVRARSFHQSDKFRNVTFGALNSLEQQPGLVLEQSFGSDDLLEDVLAHVRVDGRQGIVQLESKTRT